MSIFEDRMRFMGRLVMRSISLYKYSCRLLVLVFFVCLLSKYAYATGIPPYLPDGSHPRIWLTPTKLATLKARMAANTSEWQVIFNFCEANLAKTGYAAPIGTNNLIGFDGGYRGSGWSDHILNYALAYQVLNGTAQQAKADQYAARAVLLLNNLIRGMSVGEEENGLGMIRVGDYNDRTINQAEATALKAQNPNMYYASYKEGYAARFASSAVAIAYDWLWEKLTSQEKTKIQRVIYRQIDWVLGKRSVYNNGVLWQGTRYYEDTDGPCAGTTAAGEVISCTATARTDSRGNQLQAAFASTNMDDNYWAGYFHFAMIGALATYGDNLDALGYLNFVRDTWWKNGLKQKWADPKAYKGGDANEGWNYGNGWQRDFLTLMALQSATGEDVFSDVMFPTEMMLSYIHSTASNLVDMPPTGDWGGVRGNPYKSNVIPPLALLQERNDPVATYAKYYYDHATFNPAGSLDSFKMFIFYDPSAPAGTPLASLPLSNRNVGTGLVTMRNSWDDTNHDSIHAAFVLKPYNSGSSHDNYDGGHFYIQRGNDRLFSDSNGHESWRHSTISFGGTTQQAAIVVHDPSPGIVSYEDFGGGVYTKANLTECYTRDSVGLPGGGSRSNYASIYYKSMLYIRPNLWIIYDVTRSGAQAPTQTKEWYIKGSNALTIDTGNNTVISLIGSSKAYLKTIYPQSVSFTQGTIYADPYAPVLIKPNVTQEYDQFLHVIEATASTSANMTPTEKVQSAEGKMIGTYIKDPVNPNVVMFSTDQNGNDVTGNVTYTLSALTGKSPWHTIVHLPPNADYTVIRPANNTVPQTYQLIQGSNPTQGAVYKSSSQGVLRLPPAVTIQSPADGATIAGKKKVSVSIPDTFAVTAMDILVDGNPASSTFTAPNSVELNTLVLTEGAHTIAVVASDADGNKSQSSPISVMVVRDTVKPVVAIADPVPGQTVFGSYTVNITATDNFDVASVNFYVNSVLKGVIGSSPYSISWDTKLHTDGNYTLTADATDSSGNTGSSAPVGVKVMNNAAQTITVNTPAPANATYGSSFTVAATASSGLPVAYSSGSPGVCTNAGATFTMKSGTGTCVVQYDQAGSGPYGQAPQITSNTTATRAALTITANAQTKVYGTADPTLTYVPSGLTNGDTTVVLSGALARGAGVNVGSYAINQGTLSAGGNYTITFVGANLTITKATPLITWANPANIAYGTLLSATQLNASSGSLPGSFSYTPASGTKPKPGLRTLSVDFVPTDTANYNSVNATTAQIRVLNPSGDINNDGVLDLIDALLALKLSVGVTPQQLGLDAGYLDRGDVGPFNGSDNSLPNDVIDTGDAIIILRKILKLINL